MAAVILRSVATCHRDWRSHTLRPASFPRRQENLTRAVYSLWINMHPWTNSNSPLNKLLSRVYCRHGGSHSTISRNLSSGSAISHITSTATFPHRQENLTGGSFFPVTRCGNFDCLFPVLIFYSLFIPCIWFFIPCLSLYMIVYSLWTGVGILTRNCWGATWLQIKGNQ